MNFHPLNFSPVGLTVPGGLTLGFAPNFQFDFCCLSEYYTATAVNCHAGIPVHSQQHVHTKQSQVTCTRWSEASYLFTSHQFTSGLTRSSRSTSHAAPATLGHLILTSAPSLDPHIPLTALRSELIFLLIISNNHVNLLTRKQSEPAHLRQGHVVRQVAVPYSVWQQFLLCPIESNVNENF